MDDDQPTPVTGWGPGRILRLCAAVDETALAAVPSERPRYTAMGGIVLGTALMAMLSMSYALYCVFDGFRPFIVGVVLVWGLFILNIDRWLVAGAAVKRGSGAWSKMLPRLLLSVALGAIVAEPLLLGVFNTAIEERIAADRATELSDRESLLRDCNPVPGTPGADRPEAKDPTCVRLVIDGSPEALQIQLDATRAEADELRRVVDADSKEHAGLEETSRLECNGNAGPGLTGLRGVGPNCTRLRNWADEYYRTHHIAENTARLAALNDKVKDLTADVGSARTDYGMAINNAIRADLDGIRERHGAVGLLERFTALEKLVHESGYVLAVQWALRLFLIIVDALPVLLKVFTGETAYDRVAAGRIRRWERREEMINATKLDRHATEARFIQRRTQQEHRARRRQLDQDLRIEFANLDQEREALLAAREQFLLRTALGPAVEAYDPEAAQEVIVAPVRPRRSDEEKDDAPGGTRIEGTDANANGSPDGANA